jgi:hypothetical protein
VERLGSIAEARPGGTGKDTAHGANPHSSMERRQRIHVGEPKSQPEDLERHLVHSGNHGSSVSDLRISPEYFDNILL